MIYQTVANHFIISSFLPSPLQLFLTAFLFRLLVFPLLQLSTMAQQPK